MPVFHYQSCCLTISVMTCSESFFGLLSLCCIMVGTSGCRSCCIVVGTSGGRSCCIVVGTRSCCIVIVTNGGSSYCIVIGMRDGCPYCIGSGKCILIGVGCIEFMLS